MKRINSKNIFIGLLILALAICIWFLLQPDKQHDSHKSDRAEVVADKAAIDKQGVNYRRVIDSLSVDNYRLDSTNKSLIKGQAITEGKLNIKTAEAKALAKEIQKHNKDTGEQARRIDSLVAQLESVTFLLTQYQAYADSINTTNDSLKIGYEAIKKEDSKRIAELQGAYDKLYKSYIALFDTTAGLQKDLKRQKLKTKVAAVLGGALAVLALLK